MVVTSQINNLKHNSYTEYERYETAARIIEEENKAKCTMPSYPELEAYQLTVKLGE